MVPKRARTFVIVALLASAGCSSPYEPPVHADADHAIATVYVRKPLARGFRLEGTFSLPRMPFNRGWYGDWFTYTAKPTLRVTNPPFVQAGLIRTPNGEFVLRPFIAFRGRSEPDTLHELAPVADRPHRVALQLRGGELAFEVDGATVYRLHAHDFVAPGARSTYLQIGHELSVQDDFAKGSIRELAFSSGAKPALRPLSTTGLGCSFSSNGVSWQPAGTSVVANGKFDAAVADVSACTP
jgi:hypothetical protein